MQKKDDTVRYTAEELADMSKRGETHSDWAKAAALTNDEIEAQIAADPDEGTAECLWQSSNSGNEWIDPSFCPTTLGPR